MAGSDIQVILVKGDGAGVLGRVAPGVFDNEVDPILVREFLEDRRHHLVVALSGEWVVGMASAVHYVHPDKPAELWINEIGVAESYRGRGIGQRLLQALLARGSEVGCGSAWVLTEEGNDGAVGLYEGAGGKRANPDPVMFEFRLGDGCGAHGFDPEARPIT